MQNLWLKALWASICLFKKKKKKLQKEWTTDAQHHLDNFKKLGVALGFCNRLHTDNKMNPVMTVK